MTITKKMFNKAISDIKDLDLFKPEEKTEDYSPWWACGLWQSTRTVSVPLPEKYQQFIKKLTAITADINKNFESALLTQSKVFSLYKALTIRIDNLFSTIILIALTFSFNC